MRTGFFNGDRRGGRRGAGFFFGGGLRGCGRFGLGLGFGFAANAPRAPRVNGEIPVTTTGERMNTLLFLAPRLHALAPGFRSGASLH